MAASFSELAISIPAEPEPIAIEPRRTALIVNDLQNAFCSKGGYLDLLGFDISRAAAVVARNRELIATAHRAGLLVIHLQNGFSPEQWEAPGPQTPIWHKSNALRFMRANPAQAGRVLTHGSWDYAFVDEVAPQPGALVIPKSRDDGFAGTALDQTLRARAIRSVVISGIATNVGVESTLRAAYHREYFAILASDATMPAGPPELQQATEFNVIRFFGWVATTSALVTAFAGPGGSSRAIS